MNIFDEQTDFSFLNITDTKSVSSTEQRKDRSVKTDKITIGVSLSRPTSEETRAKMRQAHLGHTLSEESRAKLSAFMKGRKFSEESRAKLSASLKGRKISEATKAKISQARLGRPSPTAIPVMTPNGAFRSLKEASKFYGTDDSFIRRAMKWDIGFYYITKD